MQVNRRGLGLILLALLIGCNSSPEKPEDQAALENPEVQAMLVGTKVIVSAQVNPDINTRASPVVVRMFELKNLGIYTESDFYDLFENYESVLGGDLVATEQFHLNPGDIHTFKNSISPGTHYIAVIAAFRDINQAMWRGSIAIEVKKSTQLLIYVDKLNISVWKK